MCKKKFTVSSSFDELKKVFEECRAPLLELRNDLLHITFCVVCSLLLLSFLFY